MVNERFELKHSRLAIVFQLCFMGVISLILYFAINLAFWMLCIVLMVVACITFNRRPKIKKLEQLEQSEWSLEFEQQNTIHRLKLTHFIDHHFYIVVYFSDQKIKNIVIWRDQLDLMHWKKLKIRAKMN